MLQIPFALKPVPAEGAAEALERLRSEWPGTEPVLLGDADIFSTEWAECVDAFDPPEEILSEAAAVDVEAWFARRIAETTLAEAHLGRSFRPFGALWRIAMLPVDLLLLPLRLVTWPFKTRRPKFVTRSPFDAKAPDPAKFHAAQAERLKSQLLEFESIGEGTPDELRALHEAIDEIDRTGALADAYPDPIDYVTPRTGTQVAAGLLKAGAPWEGAAWLQHGTYAATAPKPVLVALCRWMWETHGARIITASTDHIGFAVERPINNPAAAKQVLDRFAVLGADEVNGDAPGSDGSTLVGATRLWVWWD